MNELTIRFLDELPGLLWKTDREFADEARFLFAANLSELGKISSGGAAATRLEFLRRLADDGIAAFDPDQEEAQVELHAARDLAS